MTNPPDPTRQPTGYPVLLNVAGWSCVVVGGGRVAARKVEGLLAAGAQVTVISPALAPPLQKAVGERRLAWLELPYSAERLAARQPRLVIAATDDPAVNAQVVADSREIGALVSRVDRGAAVTDPGDFSNMLALHQPPLTLALSTNGAAPALTTHLRDHLATAIGDEYATLAAWLGEIRPRLKASLPPDERRALYQRILKGDVLALLRQGDEIAARRCFDALVQTAVQEVSP